MLLSDLLVCFSLISDFHSLLRMEGGGVERPTENCGELLKKSAPCLGMEFESEISVL